MVREIFGKYASGLSPKMIAADLNARNIPSPGSSWKRTQRRASGWMGSAIRVMVRNERYRGVVHWNASEWRKDPDSGKRRRVARPRADWISYVDESMRIVSDELWESARRRNKRKVDDKPLKTGGKPRFLLSGLLICDTCSAHYTIANQTSYGCSSYHNGRACSNSIKVRRDRIESILLDPIRKELLSPKRAELMARDMQADFVGRSQEEQARAAEQPHELQEISARIDRLRPRLRQGDADITTDELQAAIDRAETKKRELEEQRPGSLPAVNVLTFVPRAAELYRRQITLGLEGDPRATLKARMILRDLFGGEIRLVPQLDGALTAHWNLHPGALLSGLGTNGSGGGMR